MKTEPKRKSAPRPLPLPRPLLLPRPLPSDKSSFFLSVLHSLIHLSILSNLYRSDIRPYFSPSYLTDRPTIHHTVPPSPSVPLSVPPSVHPFPQDQLIERTITSKGYGTLRGGWAPWEGASVGRGPVGSKFVAMGSSPPTTLPP